MSATEAIFITPPPPRQGSVDFRLSPQTPECRPRGFPDSRHRKCGNDSAVQTEVPKWPRTPRDAREASGCVLPRPAQRGAAVRSCGGLADGAWNLRLANALLR